MTGDTTYQQSTQPLSTFTFQKVGQEPSFSGRPRCPHQFPKTDGLGDGGWLPLLVLPHCQGSASQGLFQNFSTHAEPLVRDLSPKFSLSFY